uniref:Uncharacterized protein n=1 Tax=Rhizophora mucronata TaxID=61149 RepID=A0A2P2NMM9_RHIMU
MGKASSFLLFHNTYEFTCLCMPMPSVSICHCFCLVNIALHFVAILVNHMRIPLYAIIGSIS